MVVDVVLPAVLGLVHVGETGISACAEAFEVSDISNSGTSGDVSGKKSREAIPKATGSSQSAALQLIELLELVVSSFTY